MDGSAVTNIAGYVISYGTSATALTQAIPVSGSTTTSALVTGLPAGTYYFAVLTVATDGTTSDPTTLTTKTVP